MTFFWSEIGSGFGEPRAAHSHQKFPEASPGQTVESHFVTTHELEQKMLFPQDLVQVLSLVSAKVNWYFPFAQFSYILIDK